MKKNELFICVESDRGEGSHIVVFSKSSVAKYKIKILLSTYIINGDNLKKKLIDCIVSAYEQHANTHSSTKIITTDLYTSDILRKELCVCDEIINVTLTKDNIYNFNKYNIEEFIEDDGILYTFNDFSTKSVITYFERLVSAIDIAINQATKNLHHRVTNSNEHTIVISILESDLSSLTNKLMSEKIQNDTKSHLDTLRLIKDCVALIEQVKSEGKVQKVEMTNVDSIVKQTKDSLVMELKKCGYGNNQYSIRKSTKDKNILVDSYKVNSGTLLCFSENGDLEFCAGVFYSDTDDGFVIHSIYVNKLLPNTNDLVRKFEIRSNDFVYNSGEERNYEEIILNGKCNIVFSKYVETVKNIELNDVFLIQ